jgi:glutamine amidotransferase
VSPSATVKVTADPDEILSADRVVFPGQGAARDCMREIDARGLREVIKEAAQSKPFLGICMGLQVLFEHSEEGDTPCLGIFQGEVLRFPKEAMHDDKGEKLKVPHMGWNNVYQAATSETSAHPLWSGIEDGSRFYYVHSYFVQPASAVASGNIFAVQFHPEKSAQAGLTLLGNFITWDPFNTQSACNMAGATCA